jgi:hypothetical protein
MTGKTFNRLGGRVVDWGARKFLRPIPMRTREPDGVAEVLEESPSTE